MLERLRQSATGWIAKILMGLLVISFAIWGVGDMFGGGGIREVAQVGSTRIDTESFRQLYQERLQQVGRQIGRGLTADQARALGLDRQLLGELVSEAALDEKTRQLRLGIADEALLARIHANPAFQGSGGRFDPGRFYEALRSAGFTEARYVDSERRLILRQQIGQALGAVADAPDVLRDAVRRFENEERSVEFVRLGREQAGEVPVPGAAEIEAYYNERQAAFRAPEYRRLIVLPLTPETLAAEIDVPEAEIKEAYESIRDRLGEPERREVDQLVVANADEARAVAEKLAAGTGFDEIVAQRGLKPADVSLGLVTRREILDRAVAEAVFALAADSVSEPIKGQFGTVFVRVTRIEPSRQPAYEEVADALRRDIASRRARSVILDRHDAIEDERAAGSTLAEVAAKVGIKAITIDAVDRSGRGPDGKPVEGVPALAALLPEAFGAAVGSEPDPVEVDGGDGYVWFDVLGITPSRDRTLEEVRERVAERFRDERIEKLLAERAEAMRARLEAGESFAAAAPGLAVETREKVRRGRAVDGLDGRALAAIFETPAGRAGVAAGADGVERVVFRVTEAEISPFADPNSRRLAELDVGIQDDILVQYVMHLQDRLGVRVNETALRSVTGGSDGN